MSKYILAVKANAKAGQDEKFRNWYKNVHIPELLQIPGFMKGTRYYSEKPAAITPYLTIYEIESDDIRETMGIMQERAKDMTRSEAIDAQSVQLELYQMLE